MGKRTFVPATSQDVRNFFAENPDKIPAGAEVSVQVSCKGRVSQSAVEVFNKAAKSHGMRYVEGQEPHMPVTYKARNHRMVTEYRPISEVRKLAGAEGKRGPLSKAHLDIVAEKILSGR